MNDTPTLKPKANTITITTSQAQLLADCIEFFRAENGDVEEGDDAFLDMLAGGLTASVASVAESGVPEMVTVTISPIADVEDDEEDVE